MSIFQNLEQLYHTWFLYIIVYMPKSKSLINTLYSLRLSIRAGQAPAIIRYMIIFLDCKPILVLSVDTFNSSCLICFCLHGERVWVTNFKIGRKSIVSSSSGFRYGFFQSSPQHEKGFTSFITNCGCWRSVYYLLCFSIPSFGTELSQYLITHERTTTFDQSEN